jgi:hypothetical protein
LPAKCTWDWTRYKDLPGIYPLLQQQYESHFSIHYVQCLNNKDKTTKQVLNNNNNDTYKEKQNYMEAIKLSQRK